MSAAAALLSDATGEERAVRSAAMPAPPSHAPAVDERLLAALERAFQGHAGADAGIDAAALQKALGLRDERLARRALATFDRDGDGVIQRQEFLDGVRALVFGSDRDKLRFAFRMHDEDGDGSIDGGEMARMIAISLAEDGVVTASGEAERLAAAVMRAADTDGNGRISFEELEAAVRERPELLQRMTRSEAQWIAPSEDILGRVTGGARSVPLSRVLANRKVELIILGLWVLVNVVLFALAFRPRPVHGGGHGPAHAVSVWNQLSRACTSCLTFDAALILVPVLRRTLTWVRRTWMGRVVPVDEAVLFHRIVGHALFWLAVGHGVAQLVVESGKRGLGAALESTRVLTGVLWLVIFAVMWGFSLSIVRRSRRFELFYFTHLLYVAWFAVAAFHASSVLLAAGLPLLGLAVEHVLRRRTRDTEVVSCEALRSGVTRLDIRKPAGFRHHAGDYVFVRLPDVARHEWHPFTLSSAPESDVLTVHVRTLGNWSGAVRKRVEEDEARGVKAPIPIQVDGPYGTPSGHIFEAKHAVLIGAGIGVTPFASVIESVVKRASREDAARLPLEKAHFFWLNRDQYAFEWFAALLEDLEVADRKRLLDVHIWMTGGRAGATALGLELSRDISHAAGARDVVTGLRTKTHMGHPDWEKELSTIAAQHAPEVVDVFFCGPPGLGKKIRPLCARLGMRFREEHF